MSAGERLESTIAELDHQREDLARDRSKLLPRLFFGSLAAIVGIGVLTQAIPAVVISGVLALVTSFFVYRDRVSKPFEEIKSQFKSAVISAFMKSYHPDIEFTYDMEKRHGRQLIRSSGLISPDEYHEEDVLQGVYKGTSFYISEVDLKNKTKNSSYTIFKGILFRLKLPGKNFPKSQIQSKPGLLKRLWHDFKKDDEYNFYYDSKDEEAFTSDLEPVFPFIKHLIERQGDLRMRIEGDEIILLMQSEMKLLDDPPPKLNRSLNMAEYNDRMGRQLNSLLYIVEALASELDVSEIQERFELKTREMVEKKIKLRRE